MLEVVSRGMARERGLGRYFTGLPCKNGHVCERRVNSGHCVVCTAKDQAAMRDRLGPDGFKAKQRIWDETYRDRDPQRKLEHSKAAVDRLLVRDPEYYRRNALEWKRANPDRFRETQVRIRLDLKINHPEILKMRGAARNAVRRVLAGAERASELTKVIGEIWDRCGGKCLCGSRDRMELDHIVPVSRGGTNAKTNLQFLCFTCNRGKRTKDFEQWLDEMTSPQGVAA